MAPTSLYSEALEKFQQTVTDRHKDSDTRKLLNDFVLDGRSNFSTPDAAKAAAGTLATDAGQKYGGVKVGKADVVPKKWIDQVLGNIDNIVTVGGFMMKNAPESVGMAWFAISLTLKAISNNYSLYALFGTGLTDITEVMIIIIHYDRLYDERQNTGFKASDLVDKLFRDTVSAYAAVLDFVFSVKKHMSGGALDKARHALKDLFNAQVPKFRGKLSDIADLKAKVLKSSQGAFQDKTMQQFGDVKAAMQQLQRDQSQTRELQLEQRQMLADMLDDFKEFKDSVKRKTPLDYLKDEFMANKKMLAPLPQPDSLIDTFLAHKHDDTCRWILQNEAYQTWSQSERGTILCLVGGPRSGKSTVIASIVQHLNMDEERALFVNYVSCVGNHSSHTMALEVQKLNRICNTLLCQTYALADADDDKISLLETCNQILRNPKSHKAGGFSGRGTQSDESPDFVDAMGKLVIALQRDTILIIDGVEDLSSEDQLNLQKVLGELTNDAVGPQRISILIGSRSDSTFTRRSRGTATCIDVNGNNRADMETVLNSRLRQLSGWSENERQQAKESVLNKAGSRFSYIDDVAIPFLEQPFQRPIAKYLSKLPEGMNESFEQAIQSMAQNYFEILKLAITWSLLAPRKLTVKEIIEAYSGVYVVDEPNNDMIAGVDDDTYDLKASALEVQQIEAASGPFLSTERTKDGQTMVNLQNARQVRTFCEHANESQPVSPTKHVSMCDNCKSTIATPSRLAVDPKIAHYEIALVLLRHLNSPLFQKRFGLLRDHTNDEPKKQDSPDQDSESSDVEDAPDISLPDGNLADNIEPAAREEPDAGQKDDASDRYSDPSVYDDVQEFDYTEDLKQGDVEFRFYDRTPELRCEINNWPYHLQEAEKLWSVEERRSSDVWTQLNSDIQEELNKFASNEIVFQNWQRIWGSGRVWSLQESVRSPLYLATLLGLSAWAEAILDNGADIHEISGGANIIQASSELASIHQNIHLLHLLLERGADPCFSQDDFDPALHMWLDEISSLPVVKTFVDHEVDFRSVGTENWTGLHAYASNGHDVEAFELIMHPKDPSKTPDINAVDENGSTPLHELLWRRDVPLNLLTAFLAVEGIDVNHDDKDSEQPLAIASRWGSLAIVKLLLQARADVHDQDEDGSIALHQAAQRDHIRCIETLLAANSNLEFRDKRGSTPLQHAAFLGRKNAVELLVAKGSDINGTSNRNHTPFFNATRCSCGGQETAQFILTELKKRGYTAGEVNKVSKGGRTPLRQAASHGFADVLQELLEYIDETSDADVKATLNRGDEKLKRTPLHCATLRGDPRCIQLLLKYGADATLQDSEGNTSLMIALELSTQRSEGSFEQALLLLIDADQQAAIADAELPSIVAASGSLRVLQKLHSLQADLHRTDSFGWTPLAHAKQLGHKEVERFLKHEARWGSVFPSKWADKVPQSTFDVDGSKLVYQKGDRVCVVSDKPLPPSMEKFYYEITLETLEGNKWVAFGFCTVGASPHVYPGWAAKKEAPSALSWGYHSDDGNCYHSPPGRIDVGEIYGPGDTVGCGVNLETHKMWFTKNGKKLAHEFEGVKGRLFPILGLRDPVSLKTNFGHEPFLWNDEQVVNGVDSE